MDGRECSELKAFDRVSDELRRVAGTTMAEELTKPSEGWAVELTGHAVDLDDLREMLAAPFEPWVEDYQHGGETVLLLRSAGWRNFEDSAGLMASAAPLVARLNGAKLIAFDDSIPVSLGRIFRFGGSGDLRPAKISISASLSMGRVRVRARGRLDGGQSQVPVASVLQKRLNAADGDERRADLFTHVARADNWYDVYKAMEQVERIAGRGKRWKAAAGQDGAQWSIAKRTANFYRHAAGVQTLPDYPPSLAEARSLLLRVARQVV